MLSSNPLVSNKINTKEIHDEWTKKKVKLIEFGIHTKFSALDGISSPIEYVQFSNFSDYDGYVIADHSSVQSFPEFSEANKENKNLNLFYGCEFEMIEDSFPSYVFLNNYKQELILNENDIDELTYCAFDLETTGLFSLYDEIIEIGYVIWKKGKVIQEKSFLVKAQKEISKEIIEITGITNESLENSYNISEVLLKVYDDWKNNSVDLIVSHNALDFDLPFLRKVWFDTFSSDIPYPFLDSLILSRIVIPDKKSYSLEKLTNSGKSKKEKIIQEHRALSDSILLKGLIEKIIKEGKK
ncbi:MAG TPA: exonuclease domain-containing protein, partial [Mycoplasmatales bacterium]|nr:exonuclease domain-containing protein [Mycoplasmatales bacterium]